MNPQEVLSLISHRIEELIDSYLRRQSVIVDILYDDCDIIDPIKVIFHQTENKHFTNQQGTTKLYYIDIGHPNVLENPKLEITTLPHRTGKFEITGKRHRDGSIVQKNMNFI